MGEIHTYFFPFSSVINLVLNFDILTVVDDNLLVSGSILSGKIGNSPSFFES